MADPVAKWSRVAFIRFGSRRDELGTDQRVPFKTEVPIIPRSFAVAPDGSLWLIDVIKKRLAHYSITGGYLGAIRGLHNDRYHPHPRDVTFVGDRAWVTQELGPAGTLTPAGPHRMAPSIQLRYRGKPLVIHSVYSSGDDLLALLNGYASLDELGAGPSGFAVLNPEGHPQFRLLPGIPVGAGAWMNVGGDPNADQEFTIESSGRGSVSSRPILVRASDERGRRFHSVVGPAIEGALPNQIVVYVMLSATEPKDVDRHLGGRFFLRVSNDGSPIAWERLPEPGISDSYQTRHLAVGPDGRIYLMVAEKRGMLILRR